MKTKKVLFTAHVDSHILAFHTPYLKYFKDKGYEVHVASHGDATVPYTDVKYNVPIERSPLKLNNLRSIRQLKKIIDQGGYELIHTHTPMGSVVTRLSARQARKKGTRVIYTAHGFHFFTGAPVLNWLVYYPIEKLLARSTDDLITINGEDYQRAKAKFATKVHYVPGVGIDSKKLDVKMTKAGKTKLRKSLGLKDSDFVMLYPAELNKNKNQTMLIRAMKQIVTEYPDIHLLLPGRDNMNDYHQKLIYSNGLSANIHLIGFRDDIPQLLAIADISVSTSHREGLPVNIMEALYMGNPVVVTNCRGNRDLVAHGQDGFIIEQEDDRSLAQRIIELRLSHELVSSFSKSGQKKAQVYLLDSILASTQELYRV